MKTLAPPPPTRAQAALTASPQPELRRLRATESETDIVITGCVSSYYQKQMAQETVMRTAPGVRVLNEVKVD